jgi:antitoxin component YwqK of YwqJK toxin-antitoxin module
MTESPLLLIGLGLLGAVALVVSLQPSRPAIPAEVTRGDLDLHGGMLYLHGSPQPYSGELVAKYVSGAKKARIDLRQGKVDGLSQGWYENGQLEVEEHFVAGVSEGLRTRWHANGQKRSEEQIERGVVVGHYVEWHENGRKAVEMTLRNGKPEGLAEAWHPDGILKSQAHFALGKMGERKFFPDSLPPAKTTTEVAGL